MRAGKKRTWNCSNLAERFCVSAPLRAMRRASPSLRLTALVVCLPGTRPFGGLSYVRGPQESANATVFLRPGDQPEAHGWDQTTTDPLRATAVVGNTRVNIWKWDLPPVSTPQSATHDPLPGAADHTHECLRSREEAAAARSPPPASRSLCSGRLLAHACDRARQAPRTWHRPPDRRRTRRWHTLRHAEGALPARNALWASIDRAAFNVCALAAAATPPTPHGML